MAKNKNVEISLEEKLKKFLVPVDEQPYAMVVVVFQKNIKDF